MWSGLPQSLTLQLISIHVQKVHEHLICREGVIKGRCNLCFPRAWGGQRSPRRVQRPKLVPLSPAAPAHPSAASARGFGDELSSLAGAGAEPPSPRRVRGSAACSSPAECCLPAPSHLLQMTWPWPETPEGRGAAGLAKRAGGFGEAGI